MLGTGCVIHLHVTVMALADAQCCPTAYLGLASLQSPFQDYPLQFTTALVALSLSQASCLALPSEDHVWILATSV